MNEYTLTKGTSIILDLIRGVSAQLVVVGHGIRYFGIFMFLQPPSFPLMQNIAVLVFFLLSGFLITYSTIRKKANNIDYNFQMYFIERFSRIFTAFIPAIIFVVIIDSININTSMGDYIYHAAFNFKTFFGNILMLQDFPLFRISSTTVITSFGSGRPFWTLAIEWWIYLFFGYLVLIFEKKEKKGKINIFVLGFLSIVPLYNLVGGRGNGLSLYWIFGAIVYLLVSQNILDKVSYKNKIIMGFAFLVLAILKIYTTMQEYEPIFAFLLAILLLFVVDLSKDLKLSPRVIKYIRFNASYSYTLFITVYLILFQLTLEDTIHICFF